MSATWMTKYGPRRVRHEPPTLEEALFAAEDLALDKGQQIEIAAELMQLPVDQVRADAERIVRARLRRPQIIAGPRSAPSTVVVERKFPRRIQSGARNGPSSSR